MTMKSIRLAAALACIALFPATQALASEGEELFKKQCSKCHTLVAGKHAIGPSLAGIVGKPAGKQDFKKYKALVDVDVVWTDENLDGWLEDPKKFIGAKTTMTNKVKTPEERAAIIEYMKQN